MLLDAPGMDCIIGLWLSLPQFAACLEIAPTPGLSCGTGSPHACCNPVKAHENDATVCAAGGSQTQF